MASRQIPTLLSVLGLVIIGYSIINAVMSRIQPKLWEILVCVIVPLAAVITLVFSWKKYKKDKLYYENCLSRLSDILSETEQLTKQA